jgi:hypothetical protein
MIKTLEGEWKKQMAREDTQLDASTEEEER